MAKHHLRIKVAPVIVAAILAGYGVIACITLPALWTHYEHQKGRVRKDI
jgi:hypothetical protein